jgi:RimJ/RimL family protein N-acetyltransferase
MRAAGPLATLGLLLSGIDAYADALIRNVNVCDGTSGPPFAADVRIHHCSRRDFHEIMAAMDKVIDTGRLILRRFTLDDLHAFHQLVSRPEIIRYAQSTPLASLEEAREFMKAAPFHDYATYGYGRFACVWKESGAVIGFSGLKYVPEISDTELGYRFFPEFWGIGLATEAGRASIDFARFDLGLKRLVALVHPENFASAKVLVKLGFSVEKQLRYSGLKDIDVHLFARDL